MSADLTGESNGFLQEPEDNFDRFLGRLQRLPELPGFSLRSTRLR